MLGPERAAPVCGGRIRMRQGIAAQARFHARAEQPRGFARGTEVRPSELRDGPPGGAVADHAQHLRREEKRPLGRAVDSRVPGRARASAGGYAGRSRRRPRRAPQTTTWTLLTRMPRTTTTWAETSAETTSPDHTGAGCSIRARRFPEVDPAIRREPVDVFQLAGRQLELLERAYVLLQLGHAAGPDQRRRDAGGAQGPGQRQLRQRLAASAGDLMEAPHLPQGLFRQQIGRKRTGMAGSRAGRDASKVSVGEQALREWGEDDAADSLVPQHL